jgi:hypothetical protein
VESGEWCGLQTDGIWPTTYHCRHDGLTFNTSGPLM